MKLSIVNIFNANCFCIKSAIETYNRILSQIQRDAFTGAVTAAVGRAAAQMRPERARLAYVHDRMCRDCKKESISDSMT